MKKVLFFFLFCFLTSILHAEDSSEHVFVVSEWLPKENCEEQLFKTFKYLMEFTSANEKGCLRAHATRQIPHPGATGQSKYRIILLQEYENIDAFNAHCRSPYVREFVEKYLIDETTSPIKEWRCRLFSEN